MATLAEITQALQEVGQAVTRDDELGFRVAVKHAEEVGCTAEQIRDAYDYRNGLRNVPASFPFQSEPYVSRDLRRAAELAGESVEDFVALPGSATAFWHEQVKREKAGLPLEKVHYPFRVVGGQES